MSLYDDLTPYIAPAIPGGTLTMQLLGKAADLISKAKQGDATAKAKVRALKELADAGNPKAQQTVATMKVMSKVIEAKKRKSYYDTGLVAVGAGDVEDHRKTGQGGGSSVSNSAIKRGQPNPYQRGSVTVYTPGGNAVRAHASQSTRYDPNAAWNPGLNAQSWANAYTAPAQGGDYRGLSASRPQTFYTTAEDGTKVDQDGVPYTAPGVQYNPDDGQFYDSYGNPTDQNGNPLDPGPSMQPDPYGQYGMDPYGGQMPPYMGPYQMPDPYGVDPVSQTNMVWDDATQSFYSNNVAQKYDAATDSFIPDAAYNPYNPYMANLGPVSGGWTYNRPYRQTMDVVFDSGKSPGVMLAARELYNRGMGRPPASAKSKVLDVAKNTARKLLSGGWTNPWLDHGELNHAMLRLQARRR